MKLSKFYANKTNVFKVLIDIDKSKHALFGIIKCSKDYCKLSYHARNY